MTELMEGAVRNLSPIVLAASTRGSSDGWTAGVDGGVMGMDEGVRRWVLIPGLALGLRKDQRRAGGIGMKGGSLGAGQGAAVGQSCERRGKGYRAGASGRGPGARTVFPTKGGDGEGAMCMSARARMEAGTSEVVRPRIGRVVARTWASTWEGAGGAGR